MKRETSTGFELRSGAAGLATILIPLLLGFVVFPFSTAAQNLLLDRLDPTPNTLPPQASPVQANDPLLKIESALAQARQKRGALEQPISDAGTLSEPPLSTSHALLARLIRVLEQRREAQIRTNALNLGRAAIEAGLARDPSELFGDPPPFPVPILDGVLQSWRREADQLARQQIVLDDRKGNSRLAREAKEDLEKERRRLRDVLKNARNEVDRVRLDTELRALTDKIRIATEQATLAGQRVQNAAIQHEIKSIATRQARAALAWVESHLTPRETDLADAIGHLDRDRFELEGQIDRARSRLTESENTLRTAEERGRSQPLASASTKIQVGFEIEARANSLSHQQHIVALLNQRVERLGRMQISWNRRYATLGDHLDLRDAPHWRETASNELERLTRLRRIHETEIAELHLGLASLLRETTETERLGQPTALWRKTEIADLETLVGLYQSDLSILDSAIALEERLRAELSERLKGRDLGERMRGFAGSARSFWSFELTTSGDHPITPGKIVIAILVFAVGFLFARFMMRLLASRFFPRLGFDSGASNAFASLTFYALLGVTFLFALRAVNIPLTAFAVVGGALALGIGFGSQAIVSNFISGLLLLAERPIRTGDLIEIGGVVGSVDTIGLRSTRIRTADNFHIIVPNSSFLETNVINWTHEDPRMRLRVAVGVAYGSPAREVERLLVKAASDHPRTLSHPVPMAYFDDFADSALLFEVRFWIRYHESTDRSAILSDIRFRIDELFAENGIVIAFPQLDIHLDSRPGNDSAAAERLDSTLDV